ncbi:hypothetical protein EDB87DRAFT_1695960 [Lactarius vividus]|nr:hypothetical protein EDB87DRAFT_1695960 [Lactarius vividus]
MPEKKMKQDAKPTSVDHSKEEAAWSDDETSDEDYDSGLESDGLFASSNIGSITSGKLHLLAADLEDEVQGVPSEVRQDVEITDEQASMLQKHIVKFQAANAEDANFDREVVETECKRFNFHHKQWTYQDILVDHHQKELDKMAVEMSGSASGSWCYLGCYKKALKLIGKRLDEETWVKYRAEVKKWAEQNVPPQQQQWMFEKHVINTIQDFSEIMYCQYGVHVAILGGYCDDDGPSIMFYDNNHDQGGTSFKNQYKGWSKDPLVEAFSRWTAESFGDHPADSDEDQKKKDKTPEVKLLTDEKGYPVLPSWEAIDREGLM